MSNTTAIEAWTCKHCGKRCERPKVRGQKPKWCSQQCADLGKKGRSGTCAHCGTEYLGLGTRYCSPRCNGAARRKPPAITMTPEELTRHWASQRSPLRAAIEDQDLGALRVALRDKTTRNADGCMEWNGRVDRNGYPRIAFSGRSVSLHRLVLEVSHGAALGAQHAHHTCANAKCLNPEHLVPATHHHNIAEMKARQSYVARIRELEDALREVAPDHQALAVLPFI